MESTFPSTGLRKPHFESLRFISGEQAEVPSIPLGTPGSRHMVPLGFGDSWMGNSGIHSWEDTQVSTAGTWAPKVDLIVPEHSGPCSTVRSNISV